MGRILDIAFPQTGMIITIFRFLQFAVLFDNNFVDFSFSIWKAGIHLHLVYEERNRCLEIVKHKQT
ncbi:hypothetical protein CMI47_15525 [Candidatus Pacearchaeota archaeon]|jgi:hypothetical protein|nr:hypothetical protein [Candidatus Pacearchaeota archaeon]